MCAHAPCVCTSKSSTTLVVCTRAAAAAAAALGGGAAAHAEPKAKRWGKSRPYPARVVAVEPLCRVTNKHDKVSSCSSPQLCSTS